MNNDSKAQPKKRNKAKDQSNEPDEIRERIGNKWFITPGLGNSVSALSQAVKSIYCSSSQRMPLLIYGDTGVGKWMFADFFVAFYSHYAGVPSFPVFRFNCSEFDSNLIRSELFGHKKGSFTGADYDKIGLLKIADGGVAILEEIGELSKSDQAKLLTFIDNGNFYPIGSTSAVHSKVIIVGTTNRKLNDEELFQKDFIARFEQFFVPPLYSRRGDVLYYLAEFSPVCFISISIGAVFYLLTHSWPENVRGIRRFANFLSSFDLDKVELRSYDIRQNAFPLEFFDDHFIPSENYAGYFDYDVLNDFFDSIRFGPYKLSFAFPRNINPEIAFCLEPFSSLKFKCCSPCKEFDDYYQRLKYYCTMFSLNVYHSSPLYDIQLGKIANYSFSGSDYPALWKPGYNSLLEDILNYRRGEKPSELESSLPALSVNPLDHFPDMTEKDIPFQVYKDRLERYGHNMKNAAKSLNIPYTTFRDKLKRDFPELKRKL